MSFPRTGSCLHYVGNGHDSTVEVIMRIDSTYTMCLLAYLISSDYDSNVNDGCKYAPARRK